MVLKGLLIKNVYSQWHRGSAAADTVQRGVRDGAAAAAAAGARRQRGAGVPPGAVPAEAAPRAAGRQPGAAQAHHSDTGEGDHEAQRTQGYSLFFKYMYTLP